MDLARAFADQFPIASDTFSLELVAETVNEVTGEVTGGVDESPDGEVRATLRTIVWAVEDGVRSVRDIREQTLVIVGADHIADPRVPAYFAGWAAAMRHVLERHAELAAAGALADAVRERLEYSLPMELVFPEVLRLRRPRTADEFTDALLAGTKRLGRLLP